MDVRVIKSSLDQKNYKFIKLQNGLTVLLIYENPHEGSEKSSKPKCQTKTPRDRFNGMLRSRLKRKHSCLDRPPNIKESRYRNFKRARRNLFRCRKTNKEARNNDDDDGDDGKDDRKCDNIWEKRKKDEDDDDDNDDNNNNGSDEDNEKNDDDDDDDNCSKKSGKDESTNGDDGGNDDDDDGCDVKCDKDKENEKNVEKDTAQDVCQDTSDEDVGFLSAASLCVGVGSLSDPKCIPGLAHYLEHMVFMGSEKYPATNDFDLFIKSHGGNTNAHTDYEKTHFHFEIQSKFFCPALHRFAQFFICPLLHKEALIAEARVVHAEWQMNIQKERSRLEQLMLSMANSKNPFNNFMWGNYKTLVEEPKKRKIDVNDALQCFRNKYYVAQNMALCLYTDSKIEVVEKFVRNIFNKIPSSEEKMTDFSIYGDPFDTPEFRKIYKVVPVHDCHQLEVTWTFPSMIKHYRSRPLYYLEQLIGHKGGGSLFSQLHKRNWILSLSCGNSGGGMDWNSCISIFRVIFCLTQEGFQHSFEIITTLFQYLQMLRTVGPMEDKWKEMCQIQMNEFIYSEPTDYQEYVDLLCTGMMEFEPQDCVISNYVITEFNPEMVSQCLSLMTADRMNLVMRDKCFKSTADKTEKWFKSKYSVEEIPNAWLRKWTKPPRICKNAFHMPVDNRFIATDFTLRAAEKQYVQLKEPLVNMELGRVWYQSDNDFRIPKAYVYIYFWSQYMNRTATESCLSDMFVNYVRKSLLEDIFPAELAYFSHHIGLFNNGLVLKLGGFNHKLRLLFELYIDKMSSVDIEESSFSMTKLQLIDHYTNNIMCPELLNSQMQYSHLLARSWTFLEKLQCINSIDVETLCSYVSNIFKGMFFEVLVQGNISSKESLSMTSYLIDHLDIMPHDTRIKINVTEIHQGCTIMLSSNKNPLDNNSVITNYYQFGPGSLKEQLLNEFIFLLMEEPCFEELRTNKQLGYNVFPTMITIYGIIGFNITACSQAKQFNMEQLDDAIDEFLTNFHNRIMNMKEESFQSTKLMMLNSRGIDGSLIGQMERCWEEIINHDYLFDRSNLESRKINAITLADLKHYCKCLIPHTRSQRRKLSVQVIGNEEKA